MARNYLIYFILQITVFSCFAQTELHEIGQECLALAAHRDTLYALARESDGFSLAKITPRGRYTRILSIGTRGESHLLGIQADTQAQRLHLLLSFRDSAQLTEQTLNAPPNGRTTYLISWDLRKQRAQTRALSNSQQLYQIRDFWVDGAGAVFVCGQFQGNLRLGSGALVQTDTSDFFVAKIAADGRLLWTQHSAGRYWAEANCLAVDAAGYCYVAGAFRGTWRFDTLVYQANMRYADLFWMRLSPNGKAVQTRVFGGVYDAAAARMRIHGAGVYLLGDFAGVLRFDTLELRTPFKQHRNIFLAKLDTRGLPVWVRQTQTTANAFAQSLHLQGDQIYAAGYAQDSVHLAPRRAIASGGFDALLLQLDSSGQTQRLWLLGESGHELGRAVLAHATGLFLGGSQQPKPDKNKSLPYRGVLWRLYRE